MTANVDLIFKSSFVVESMDIDLDCEEGDDGEIVDAISDQLRMGFEAIANNLRERFPQVDLRISFEV
jgi:hypothetical protein